MRTSSLGLCPLRLYDTQRSGNAWKVRLLAGFLGIPLDRTSLSIDRGDLRAPSFTDINPLRQVPALELPDGHVIAESMAILFYLAAGSDWWPGDRLSQARVLTWLSFEQSRHMHPLAQLRLHRALHPDWPLAPERAAEWRNQAEDALECLERQLSAAEPHGWIATGRHPSIADVALYPYTRLAPMGGIGITRHRAISDWIHRFEQLPGYEPLFPGRPELTETTREI